VGLTDVVLVNRMLLWGLMTLACGIAIVANGIALLSGSYMSPLIVMVSSVLGLVSAICLFLAFRPPAWYTRWLEQGYAAEVG